MFQPQKCWNVDIVGCLAGTDHENKFWPSGHPSMSVRVCSEDKSHFKITELDCPLNAHQSKIPVFDMKGL